MALLQSTDTSNQLSIEQELGADINKGLDVDINIRANVDNSTDVNLGNDQVKVQTLDISIDTELGMGSNIGLDLDNQVCDIEIDQRNNIGHNRVRVLAQADFVLSRTEFANNRTHMRANIGNHQRVNIGLNRGLHLEIRLSLGADFQVFDIHVGTDQTEGVNICVEFDNHIGADVGLEVNAGIDQNLALSLNKELDEGLDNIAIAALQQRNGGLLVRDRGKGLSRGGEKTESQDGGDESADSHYSSRGRGRTKIRYEGEC
ncbi:hypothetical protein EDD21DRAFT_393367 [Dissophora ornata]|nr:hypothetical protein EDD21DRAFT_393367 [Dissophora ornata]